MAYAFDWWEVIILLFLTIQQLAVLKMLQSGKCYQVTDTSNLANRKYMYEELKAAYAYTSLPIFMSPVGVHVEMYGARTNDEAYVLELDIPREECHFQNL